MLDGFITPDFYAAIPWGKKLVIVYKSQQLGHVNTVKQAHKFIKDHRESTPQKGTIFID